MPRCHLILLLALLPLSLLAGDEPKRVAVAGQPVERQHGWMNGAFEVANDPARTLAWTGEKSRYYGLAYHFALSPAEPRDLDRILTNFALIGSIWNARIVLSPEKSAPIPEFGAGPGGARPATTRAATRPSATSVVLFSIGGEKSARLTLYAGNPALYLDKLQLPPRVPVEASYDERYLKAHADDPVVRRIERAVTAYRKRAGDEAQVRLVVELARYWGAATGPFDPEEDDAELDRNRDAVTGFAFKVIAPDEFAGRYVLSHHDGLLASGHPDNYSVKGRRYHLRVRSWWIGGGGAGICSVDLDIEPVPDSAVAPAVR